MSAASPGALFGFSVESNLSFEFLRSGAGETALQVDEAPRDELAHASPPIVEWRFKDPTGDVKSTLHRADGVYHFWSADAGWFRIDPEGRRITIPREGDPTRRELRLWGVPTTLCSAGRGDVSLHAAAAEIDGGAVLFAAPGQHGKTTLVLAFHKAGRRVLTEDVACCRFGDGPLLYPGPASLRVRPDMFDGTAPPGTELVACEPDRVFLRLAAARSGSAAPVPIRAIVLLHWSDGEIRLERVHPARALPDLWALSFRLPGTSLAAQAFERVGRIAGSAAIWNLYRPKRLEDVDAVIERITEAALTSV